MRAFSSEEAKEVAALAAVEMVREGEVLAIGSGSTVDKAIRALGHRFSDSVRKPAVVAASRQSESLVREVGLPLLSLSEVTTFPLMLDGADEVAHDLTLIKGGGGALTREKLLATMSQKLIIMADYTKLVERTGEKSLLPVEVIPFAAPFVGRELHRLKLEPTLRLRPGSGSLQPFLTDNQCHILDCRLPESPGDLAELDAKIKSLRGVVESGLFVRMASIVYVGTREGRVEELRPAEERQPSTIPPELKSALIEKIHSKTVNSTSAPRSGSRESRFRRKAAK